MNILYVNYKGPHPQSTKVLKQQYTHYNWSSHLQSKATLWFEMVFSVWFDPQSGVATHTLFFNLCQEWDWEQPHIFFFKWCWEWDYVTCSLSMYDVQVYFILLLSISGSTCVTFAGVLDWLDCGMFKWEIIQPCSLSSLLFTDWKSCTSCRTRS